VQQQPQQLESWMNPMNGGPPSCLTNGTLQQMPNMGAQNQHREGAIPNSPFHPSLVQSQQPPPTPRSNTAIANGSSPYARTSSPRPDSSAQVMLPSCPASFVMPAQMVPHPPDAAGPSGRPYPPITEPTIFQRCMQQDRKGTQ
jgi:hypothetical protein